MPSPTGFDLLSSSSNSAPPQGNESRRRDSAKATDFQRVMERPQPTESRPKTQVRTRPDSAPVQSKELGQAREAERRSPLEGARVSSNYKNSHSEGVERRALRGDAGPEDSGFTTASSKDLAHENWLSTIQSPEALAELDGSEEPSSTDVISLSLEQLVEKLNQLLAQTDTEGSVPAGELSSLLARIEDSVDTTVLTPEMLRRLEAGLTSLLADKNSLQGVSQQLISQLQGILNELRTGSTKFQIAGTPEGGKVENQSASSSEAGKVPEGKAEPKANFSGIELGGPDKGPMESQLTSKLALAKSGLEASEAGALEKGASKASVIINQLSGAEAGNTRTPLLQATERSFMVQSDVRVPVGQPTWSQAVGDRVLWLAAQNLTSAELRLDPPDLGPMQVRVSMNNDQINVSFSSQQAAVREALDQGAQRLREMFNEQGLKLGDVNVSDQSEGRRFERERDSEGQGRRGSGASEEDDAPLAQSQLVSVRLVDHYA